MDRGHGGVSLAALREEQVPLLTQGLELLEHPGCLQSALFVLSSS